MFDIEKTPSLVMFNTATRFRQGIAFLSASTKDDLLRAHVYTITDQEDGLVYLKVDAEHGVSVTIDTTLKSSMLDGDVWVNLHDFCVICEKTAKEGNATLWVSGHDLYIGSCFNEGFDGFEIECCLHGTEAFVEDSDFTEEEVFSMEQSGIAAVIDTTYDFEFMEIHRNDGVVSFRTGNDRVTLATLVNSASGESAQQGVNTRNFGIRITCDIFRVIPMIESTAMVKIGIDFTRKKIKAEGDGFHVIAGFTDSAFPTDSAEGMTDYMKFDCIAMAATIDTIYNLNYKNTTAPVKITPINDGLASIEFGYSDRYSITITMASVHMYETDKTIVLPMDIITMMIRNANCNTLLLKHSDDGRLFLCYQNKFLARKCMYFG